MRDSNPRPPQCQCDALPTALTAHKKRVLRLFLMAPRVGLEPTTLRLTAECSAIELPRNISIILLYSEIKIMQILFIKIFKFINPQQMYAFSPALKFPSPLFPSHTCSLSMFFLSKILFYFFLSATTCSFFLKW